MVSPARILIIGFVAASGLRAAQPALITIDYPAEKSIFPPEITPPTFLWRDPIESNTTWQIDVTFADHSAAIQHGHVEVRAPRPSGEFGVGERPLPYLREHGCVPASKRKHQAVVFSWSFRFVQQALPGGV